jgi:hypothetical protein
LLDRGDLLDAVPGDVVWRRTGGGLDGRFVIAQQCKKIALAQDLDRPPRTAVDRLFVNGPDRRAAARLADDSGMHDAVRQHVVDEGRLAEDLRGPVDPRRVLPDDPVFGRRLERRETGRRAAEVDGRGERPIIVAGRGTAAGDPAVIDRQIGAGIAEGRRGMVEKPGAHLGAGEAQRAPPNWIDWLPAV